jgi:hypothetical protein
VDLAAAVGIALAAAVGVDGRAVVAAVAVQAVVETGVGNLAGRFLKGRGLMPPAFFRVVNPVWLTQFG